jgi:hypothetical protein
MMKNNKEEEQEQDNLFTLRRYSSYSDDGEGCEGSIEDRWLTINIIFN